MQRWRARRIEDNTPHVSAMPVENIGPLAFLGAIVGGIGGWLTSSGALPHPAFLPIPPGEPFKTGLIVAALGLLAGAILGGLADLADRSQIEDSPPRDGRDSSSHPYS